jgi:ATP-dependent RNA helicase RhlE
VIFGGVGQGAQVTALRNGVDVLVCTPGRLLDLMQQGYVDLRSVEVFVLDEADRMLDMGFIHDIRRIVPKLRPSGRT